MSNLKKWAIWAAVMGGMLFQFGSCLGGNRNWALIAAWLNEDIFG